MSLICEVDDDDDADTDGDEVVLDEDLYVECSAPSAITPVDAVDAVDVNDNGNDEVDVDVDVDVDALSTSLSSLISRAYPTTLENAT